MKKLRIWLSALMLVLAVGMLGYGGISAFLDGGAVFSRVAGVRTASEKPSAAKKKKNSGSTSKASDSSGSSSVKVKEDGTYTGKEEVAAYIHEFGHLPSNYITKNEAKDLGWDSRSGNLDEVAPGKSIGGDKFGNYEGLLPTKSGRKYYECDIDFEGGRRNAKRIIFSNDGLIYYTEDHYETFEQLY